MARSRSHQKSDGSLWTVPKGGLTYAVDEASFDGRPAQDLAETRSALRAAWAAVLPDYPIREASNAGEAAFPLRYGATSGHMVARAFFPFSKPEYKVLLVFAPFFTPDHIKAGVLLHELGHIYGFRHEHIRDEAGPAKRVESMDHVDELSAYDPDSVMHYPNFRRPGPYDFSLSDLDERGARRAYGYADRPLRQTTTIGPPSGRSPATKSRYPFALSPNSAMATACAVEKASEIRSPSASAA